MGYTSHRENVKSDGSKKATFWDNLRLKTPKEINKDDEKENKNVFGQDQKPCVDFVSKKIISNCDNIETVKAAQNEENENTPNESKRSCPSVCFFDSGKYGQDVSNHHVLDLVREQKTLVFEQNEGEDSKKNLSGCELMRTDLKNFAKSQYNLIVDSVPVFVGEFNKKWRKKEMVEILAMINLLCHPCCSQPVPI